MNNRCNKGQSIQAESRRVAMNGVYVGAAMAPAITNEMVNTLRFSINATETTPAFLVLPFQTGLTRLVASEYYSGCIRIQQILNHWIVLDKLIGQIARFL